MCCSQYSNIASLESKLYSVSSPDSADYGKYLDKHDMEAYFAPSLEAEEKVRSWLESAGAKDIESDSGLVTFTTTVGAANKMLDTKFGLYTNGMTTKLRTTQYSVPDELVEHIDLVSPTTYFGNTQAHAAIPEVKPTKTKRELAERALSLACETTVPYVINSTYSLNFTLLSPQCIKQYYNIGGYNADPNSGSTIAFGNFLNQWVWPPSCQ